MTETFTTTRTLVTEECCQCHILFAMTQGFMQGKRDNHESFFCPQGHAQSYRDKNEKERLEEQLATSRWDALRLEQRLEEERQVHETTRRQRNALKGHLTKTKNRIGNGVCPCCNRNFKNLARHMQGQHPAYSGR